MNHRLAYIRNFMAIILLTAFSTAACTDDAPVQDPNSTGTRTDNDNRVPAYIAVNVSTINGNNGTRGTEGDPEYEDGSDAVTSTNATTYDESTVHWADFYFFDANGNAYNRIGSGNNHIRLILDGQKADPADDNVEQQYGVLTPNGGIQGQLLLWITEEQKTNGDYPALMTVVANSNDYYINQPLSNFNTATIEPFVTINGKQTPIMTVASYLDATADNTTSNNSTTWPFAISLEDRHFKESVPEAQAAAVDVYVERLWTKVELGLATSLTDQDPSNDYTVFAVTVKHSTDPFTPGDNYTEKTGYIRIHGWGLNATAKNSLLMKNIDNNTNEAGVQGWGDDFFEDINWNHEDYHRSYWGKSLYYNYNADQYANTQVENPGLEHDNYGADDTYFQNIVLNHYPLTDYIGIDADNAPTGDLGKEGLRPGTTPKYAKEHTLSTQHLMEMYTGTGTACATSALVFAEFLGFGTYDSSTHEASESTEDGNLYRIGDYYYNKEELIEYLYSQFPSNGNPNNEDGANVWIPKTGTGSFADTNTDGYTQLGSEYFELVDLGNGLVGLDLLPEIKARIRTGKDSNEKEAPLYVCFNIEEVNMMFPYHGDNNASFTKEEKRMVIGNTYSRYTDIDRDGTYEMTGTIKVDSLNGLYHLDFTGDGNPDGIIDIIDDFFDDFVRFNEKTVIPLCINGYKQGWMYYNIPIEHLQSFNTTANGEEIKFNTVQVNNDGTKTPLYTGAAIKEGQYGVLRNHWYKLTVNSITGLGYGVFDPAELIVPIPKTPDDFFKIGLEAQVLDWHVVEKVFDLNNPTPEE